MHRRRLTVFALALPAVARAHGTGIEVYYAGAELLLLIVMLGVIVALRAPWRRQLVALLVLAVAAAITVALAHIPTDSAGTWLDPATLACIPVGSICALVVMLRRGPRRGRR